MSALSTLVARPVFDSRLRSESTTTAEKWFGYLVGPAGSLLLNGLLAVYLNVYYTDVMGLTKVWGGVFLAFLPILTNALVAVMNVVMGRVVDHTHTRQGKARPWLLVAAPAMALSGILLFTVPTQSGAVQLIWVAVSYNLYYSLAYSMYGVSHNLMVPLSTPDSAQRGVLSVFSQVATIAISGIVVALVFPALVLPRIGVSPGGWLTVMGVVSILVLPLGLVEYYFTRERVTEAQDAVGVVAPQGIRADLSALVHNPYVLLFFGYFILYMLGSSVKNVGLVYYSNYVLGTYADGTTQMLLSVIGGLPMGIGVAVVWPLAKRFGKRNIMMWGFVLYALGSAINWMFPTNFPIALGAQFVKNLGSVPASYMYAAFFADVLDNVRWRSGRRIDGLAMSVLNVITTACVGLSTGLFNSVLSWTGYVAPKVVDGVLVATQTGEVRSAITFMFVGLEVFTGAIIAVIMYFLNVERDNARHEAAAQPEPGSTSADGSTSGEVTATTDTPDDEGGSSTTEDEEDHQ